MQVGIQRNAALSFDGSKTVDKRSDNFCDHLVSWGLGEVLLAAFCQVATFSFFGLQLHKSLSWQVNYKRLPRGA